MLPASRRHRSINIWPGFVDVLAAVLLVFVFMLLVFVMVQFYLSGTLSSRESEIDTLTRALNDLAETLALEQDKSAGLEQTVEDLQARLQATLADKEGLSLRWTEAQKRLSLTEADLQAARQTIAADREAIALKLATIASLQQDIAALKKVRAALEKAVADLSGRLEQTAAALGQARDRSKQLEAELATAEERTLLAQKTIDQRDVRIAELVLQVEEQDRALAENLDLTETQQAQLSRLTRQVAALRAQLAEVSALLASSESRVQAQALEIETLGQRLNVALASRVKELSRYRSEFFGRMREILGDRKDIRIVGDRFVFQSEVLFATASAELGAGGKQQLQQLAVALKEVAAKIPDDIDWVLRIDGHTDHRPISSPRFPSNWELSTARSLAILRFLLDQGVPADHLLAAGFGEQHPLDPANTPEAWQKNRRIELKLTQP